MLDSKCTKMAIYNKKIERYERFAKHNDHIIDNLNECIAEPNGIYINGMYFSHTMFIKNNIKALKKVTSSS